MATAAAVIVVVENGDGFSISSKATTMEMEGGIVVVEWWRKQKVTAVCERYNSKIFFFF